MMIQNKLAKPQMCRSGLCVIFPPTSTSNTNAVISHHVTSCVLLCEIYQLNNLSKAEVCPGSCLYATQSLWKLCVVRSAEDALMLMLVGESPLGIVYSPTVHPVSATVAQSMTSCSINVLTHIRLHRQSRI